MCKGSYHNQGRFVRVLYSGPIICSQSNSILYGRRLGRNLSMHLDVHRRLVGNWQSVFISSYRSSMVAQCGSTILPPTNHSERIMRYTEVGQCGEVGDRRPCPGRAVRVSLQGAFDDYLAARPTGNTKLIRDDPSCCFIITRRRSPRRRNWRWLLPTECGEIAGGFSLGVTGR